MPAHPRLPLVALALVTGLLGLRPAGAEAQFEFLDLGVHGTWATEAFDGTRGLGAFVSWEAPLLPVAVRVAADKYFPKCGTLDGCSTWAWGVDALVRVPLPVARPYAALGWTRRTSDPGGDVPDVKKSGAALGLGLDLDLIGIRLFAEARREFLDLPADQWILRLGFFF